MVHTLTLNPNPSPEMDTLSPQLKWLIENSNDPTSCCSVKEIGKLITFYQMIYIPVSLTCFAQTRNTHFNANVASKQPLNVQNKPYTVN
jgi:hypothetical protein